MVNEYINVASKNVEIPFIWESHKFLAYKTSTWIQVHMKNVNLLISINTFYDFL